MPFLYRQNYLAADHRRDFRAFFIQTELARRWSSARFSCFLYTDRISSPLIIGEIFVPFYTDRISSPLIIGEIFVPSLYRQNYLAADHRRDFRAFFIQTELPRRWSSARFSCFLYTDRISSPLIIGEILVLYKWKFNPCIYSIIHILRTWRNFCRSVYWKNHIICVCLNAALIHLNDEPLSLECKLADTRTCTRLL